MRKLLAATLALSILFLGGCAGTPQNVVPLDEAVATFKSGKVGIAMLDIPKPDTQFPGASCLLCLAAASIANSSLTDYVRTLQQDDLPKLKEELATILRNKGSTVVELPSSFSLASLPDSSNKEPNTAKKDFASLSAKYGIDKLILLNVTRVGVVRDYAAYFPTSAPKANIEGLGYLVNLSTNKYEWYQPVSIVKGVDGSWDEAPKFPGVTTAYFEAIELSKDEFLKPFKTKP
jgi:hypothetical protein